MKKIILFTAILFSISAVSAQVVVVRAPYRRPVLTPVYVAPRIIAAPVVYVERVVRPAIIVSPLAPAVIAPVVAERYPVRRAAILRRRAVYYR